MRGIRRNGSVPLHALRLVIVVTPRCGSSTHHHVGCFCGRHEWTARRIVLATLEVDLDLTVMSFCLNQVWLVEESIIL